MFSKAQKKKKIYQLENIRVFLKSVKKLPPPPSFSRKTKHTKKQTNRYFLSEQSNSSNAAGR